MVAFWLSLLLLLVALVAGVAYVVLRGLQMWRLVKRTGDAFGRRDRAHLARYGPDRRTPGRGLCSRGPPQGSERRLADARARLDLQLAAVREARADVRRALWFVPGL